MIFNWKLKSSLITASDKMHLFIFEIWYVASVCVPVSLRFIYTIDLKKEVLTFKYVECLQYNNLCPSVCLSIHVFLRHTKFAMSSIS